MTTHPEDTGSLAAHKKFVDDAISNNLMEDANEACIACHTHIPVKINFSHKRSLEFTAGLGYPVTTDYTTGLLPNGLQMEQHTQQSGVTQQEMEQQLMVK